MTAATALVSGNDPLPQLAETAVRQALDKAGLTHANGVLLFLTPDFARHAQPAVTAAARAAQCMQVAGGIAAGVFTESGWVLDRPAAAAMVLGRGLSLGHPDATDFPILSWAGAHFPPAWQDRRPRFGGLYTAQAGHAEAQAWQQSRLSAQHECAVQVLGASASMALSSGLRLLGEAVAVERSHAYDLEAVGHLSALDHLRRALPPAYRDHVTLPLHHLSAVLIDHETDAATAVADGRYRPVAIIAANADNSLTLSERTTPGQRLAWAIRQPVAAEADMRLTLERLAGAVPAPACALMFSCIGRGPYFYDGEDRDLVAFGERFPGLPLLGAYGTSQIVPPASSAPAGGTNRLLQNAALTALFAKNTGEAHV